MGVCESKKRDTEDYNRVPQYRNIEEKRMNQNWFQDSKTVFNFLHLKLQYTETLRVLKTILKTVLDILSLTP